MSDAAGHRDVKDPSPHRRRVPSPARLGVVLDHHRTRGHQYLRMWTPILQSSRNASLLTSRASPPTLENKGCPPQPRFAALARPRPPNFVLAARSLRSACSLRAKWGAPLTGL